MAKPKFVPKEIFEQMLEWSVMPTFDLVINYGHTGLIIVKRKIAPYKNQWALPGLRQYKGERFKETLVRIAKEEVGLNINPQKATILGQYDGVFTTEHQRQDISTGYSISVPSLQKIKMNMNHFSSYKLIDSPDQIPKNMGAMYKFHLRKYFSIQRDEITNRLH